ncbi:MAG: hypothetical protein HGB15_00940 [Chlorobaculum sp.]|nr:hypothetical protein [Chlorobaculum sp.]
MQEASEAAFPRILLQGPVLDYFCRNAAFPAGIGIQVEQLAPLAEARKSPEQACIRWTTRDESGAAFALQTEAPAGTYVERLWEASVSELFITDGSGKCKNLEFEITPQGHWLALRLDAPRQ